MYEMVSENKFGICVLEEWKEFEHDHILSYGKEMFDFRAPVLTWLPRLNEVVHMFIVSRFLSPQSIADAFDIIKLCRNNSVFITIITPTNNKDHNDLKELKLKTDIFLYVEDNYYENKTITDPVSYAIYTVVMSFDEYIDKENVKFQCESPYYAFSQSGSAELVVFRLFKNDYDKIDNFELSESVAGQVRGKRIGYLLIKSGDDFRAWRIGRIKDAFIKASGSMLYASACGIGDTSIGKMTWVTAIVSDMDNPNNSYGSSQNKTAFQGR